MLHERVWVMVVENRVTCVQRVVRIEPFTRLGRSVLAAMGAWFPAPYLVHIRPIYRQI